MSYTLKYGNKYTSNEEEYQNADQSMSDMLTVIFDYLDAMQFEIRLPQSHWL